MNYFVAIAKCGCILSMTRTDYHHHSLLDDTIVAWVRGGFAVKEIRVSELRKMLKHQKDNCDCYIPF